MGRLAEQPTESAESEQARVAYQPKTTPIQARADGSPVLLPLQTAAARHRQRSQEETATPLDEGIRSGGLLARCGARTPPAWMQPTARWGQEIEVGERRIWGEEPEERARGGRSGLSSGDGEMSLFANPHIHPIRIGFY